MTWSKVCQGSKTRADSGSSGSMTKCDVVDDEECGFVKNGDEDVEGMREKRRRVGSWLV